MKNNLMPRLKPYTILWSAWNSPKVGQWEIAAFVYGADIPTAIRSFMGIECFNYRGYFIKKQNENSFTIWNGIDGFGEHILDFYIWEGIWKEKEKSFLKNPFNKQVKREDRFIRFS